MGTNLTGNNIQDTYKGLIKTNGCNAEFDSSKTILTDGMGNNSALAVALADNGICVTGTSTFTKCLNVCEHLKICGGVICDNTAARIALGATTVINNSLQVCGNQIINGSGNNQICFTTNNIELKNNVSISGNLSASGDLVAFNTSDKRLKENLEVLETNTFFDGVTGYSFDWNEESQMGGKSVGFIAQDLEKVAPGLVQTNQLGYKSVNYLLTIPYLFEEIRSLKSKIKELESKNQK